MNFAVSILKREIEKITKGMPTATVVAISGEEVFVNFDNKTLFSGLKNVELGDIVLVMGTDQVPAKPVTVKADVLDGFNHNAVIAHSVLDKETTAAYVELVAAIERLSTDIVSITSVETPKGKLVVSKLADPAYPGISIDVMSSEGYVENATTVEYNPQENHIITYVWEQDKEEAIHRNKWSK